jgi:hypothetical protein
MENNSTDKNIYDTRLEGTSKIIRPELRCYDGVNQDISGLGAKNWRITAFSLEE